MFQRELRGTDLCGRWGGEEFLVICPETAPADALTVAEKCRLAIASLPIATSEGEIAIRLSGGVSGVEAGLGVDELVKRADDALYRAKALGKNRIVGWPFQ
jgi:diguanylate cyclase (GGDEF)-like protein